MTGRASRAVEGTDSSQRKRSGCTQFSCCCSCHCYFLCPGVTSPCPVSSPTRSPAIPLLIHLAELFGCPSGSVLSGQPQGLRVDLVQASGFWSFPEALYILVFRLPSLHSHPRSHVCSRLHRLLLGGRERKGEGIGPVLTYNK